MNSDATTQATSLRPAEKQIHTLRSSAAQFVGMVPFIVQPLFSLPGTRVHAYEVLYRGIHPKHPGGWVSVDIALLRYLAQFRLGAPLFVNLSNHSILSIDESLLFAAHDRNNLYFEWSEAVAEESQFQEIVRKINLWSQRGLRFVIDDFGAGRDGFERLFAVNDIAALKIDGRFFRKVSENPMARNLVENVITECAKKNILTVAECVESAADLELAKSIGVNLVQGFYVDFLHAKAVQPIPA